MPIKGANLGAIAESSAMVDILARWTFMMQLRKEIGWGSWGVADMVVVVEPVEHRKRVLCYEAS